MAISNNNAIFVADATTFGDVAIEYFTVTVKDSSATAVDIDANTHKDGIVDRTNTHANGITSDCNKRYFKVL